MDCIDVLKTRFQGLSEDEITAIMEEVKIERNDLEQRMVPLDSLGDELITRITKKSEIEQLGLRCRMRAKTLTYIKTAEALDFISTNFAGREWEGLEALLAGVNRVGRGNRDSVDARQNSKVGFYLGGLLQDLKALGPEHLSLLKSGKYDKEIARGLWFLHDPEERQYEDVPQLALDIAKVIEKWQGKARDDANLAGAWIGKRSNYITRQTHDASRMKIAGFDEWANFVYSRIDWEKTAPRYHIEYMRKRALAGNTKNDKRRMKALKEDIHAARMDFLRKVYDSIVEDKPLPSQDPVTRDFEFQTPTAERMSESRVLIFDHPDAWMEYNSKFGYDDTLMKTITNQLSSRAKQTALMEKLGPYTSDAFEHLYDTLAGMYARQGNQKALNALASKKNFLFSLLHEVDGSVNNMRNPTLGQVARGVRFLNNWTMLGGSLWSSLVDVSTLGGEFAYQGKSFFGSMYRGLSEIFTGRGTAEQQRIASQLGVFFDNMVGEIANRYSSGDGGRGLGSIINQKFFQLNGLSWWTDSWRRTVGLMMAHDLAQEKGFRWSELSMQRQRVLKQYGIEEAEWDLVRQGNTRAADGRDYFTPEAVNDLTDAQIGAYLGLAPGETLSAPQMDRVRNEIADKLRTYFRDRIDFAVLEGGAKTRANAYSLFGIMEDHGRGTVVGEALRMAWQFKTFPLAHMERVMGRDILGREGEGFGSHASAVAKLFIVSTLFGYASMSVKDVLKGRVPRNPIDFDDRNFAKTWTSAALQGGGAGLFGDFLFGELTRHGNSKLSTFLGPTASQLENIWNSGKQAISGDGAAASIEQLRKIVPGQNLWWFKAPFDYLVAYNLYEMISPGYFERMKRRVEAMNGTTFFLRPAMAPSE